MQWEVASSLHGKCKVLRTQAYALPSIEKEEKGSHLLKLWKLAHLAKLCAGGMISRTEGWLLRAESILSQEGLIIPAVSLTWL